MSLRDKQVDKAANFAKECIRLQLGTSATGQTAKLTDAVIPGFAFQVAKVEVWALTVTATISVDVQITSTSVLTGAVTPVAATATAGTLSTAAANVRGSATEAINLLYTSNGSGAATNLVVSVWVRPLPLDGEVYSV